MEKWEMSCNFNSFFSPEKERFFHSFSTGRQKEKSADCFPQKVFHFPQPTGEKILGKLSLNGIQYRVRPLAYRQELMFAVMSRTEFSRAELPFFSSSSILVMEDKMVVWSLPPNSLPISVEDKLVRVRTR